MSIEHVLAVVPVTDIDRAADWYARLFGREPDNRPMAGLVEWQVLPGAWVQVSVEPEQAGRGLLNLAVDDLDGDRAALAGLGLDAGPVQDVTKGVRLAPLRDPDGNTITLIGSFRVVY